MAKGNQKPLDSKQSFKKDERGVIELAQLGIGILVLIVIIAVIALVGDKIDTVAELDELTAASGTVTFSGNVTTGETVNITASGTTYCFEFNTTGTGLTNAGCNNVAVSGGYNTSVLASGNLTAAINANATLAASVTAANTTNTTTITADTAGTAGNSISLAESGTNIAVSGATLTGGLAGSQWSNTVNSDIVTGVELWEDTGGLIVITAVIAIISVLLGYIFIFGRTQGRREQ